MRQTRKTKGWDYKIRSYNKHGVFMVETLHRGEHSRDKELEAIRAANRTAEVTDLRPLRQEFPYRRR